MIEGRLQDAEIAFEQAVAADSGDVLARLNLGSVRARLGKTMKAIETLERVVQLDASQSIAHMLLGQLFAQEGKPKIAEQHYREALRADARNDEAHLGLATLLRRKGRCAGAIPHFEQAIEITPGRVQAHLYLAVCDIQLGNYSKARSLLEATHDVFPYHRGVRDALVRVLAASPIAKVRDGNLALTLVQKPVADSTSVETPEAFAMAYAELGRFAKAIHWQEAAIETARSQRKADYLDYLKDNLQSYKQGKPSRTPWARFYDEQ